MLSPLVLLGSQLVQAPVPLNPRGKVKEYCRSWLSLEDRQRLKHRQLHQQRGSRRPKRMTRVFAGRLGRAYISVGPGDAIEKLRCGG